MAYATIMAAVPFDDVERLIGDSTHILSPSRIENVSHYLAYSVQILPLGKLLGEAIDGGELINPELWHPYRAPIVHHPDRVCQLFKEIQKEWNDLLAKENVQDNDWYRIEIEKVLSVFNHATQYRECVVNVMHPPFDAERADRVRIPFDLGKDRRLFSLKRLFKKILGIALDAIKKDKSV